MRKARPNDRCPCGSGRNYKKCCAKKKRGAVTTYTSTERREALLKLQAFLEEELQAAEAKRLSDQFWGDLEVPRDHELLEMSFFAFQAWAFFDADLGDHETLADLALEEPDHFSPGERAFVERGRKVPMRLYEVVGVRPGVGLTLRDLFDGAVHEVRERAASRSLHRWDVIATRIYSPGASGKPELDGGLFPIPALRRDAVMAQAQKHLEAVRVAEPDIDERCLHATLPPLYHQAWLARPTVPTLVNYDGEALLDTKAHYDVSERNRAAVIRKLDGIEGLDRDEGERLRWTWSGVGASRPEPIARGTVSLEGGRLVLHTLSRERAERGRAMLEAALGELVAHRLTESSDTQAAVERTLANGERHEDVGELPPELREPATAAVEAHYQAHYEKWIDEPVPMFDGKTPREAAASPRLRARVHQAMKDLERMFEYALEHGQPGFDPSWLREELGVFEDGTKLGAHPAPLAHEVVALLLPALPAVATQVADRVRAQSGGALDRIVEPSDLAVDIGLGRLVRDHARAVARDAERETVGSNDALLRAYVALVANFELHRRKVFWVSEPLSWALGATRLDVAGDMLQPPFASFAMVFTDRYALGLAEKMLSREPEARLRGRMLRVLTVYVTRTSHEETRSSLRVTFACDARDGDWPYLVARNLDVADDTGLDTILKRSWPDAHDDELDSLHDCVPLRDLLHLVMSAVLYATSADARREERAAPPPTRKPSGKPRVHSSENVYYLPGTIDISALRAIQHARRGAGDRAQIHRCLVRGHWRRANPGWKEERARWIEPYWRGPSIAAVVERQYRLQP